MPVQAASRVIEFVTVVRTAKLNELGVPTNPAATTTATTATSKDGTLSCAAVFLKFGDSPAIIKEQISAAVNAVLNAADSAISHTTVGGDSAPSPCTAVSERQAVKWDTLQRDIQWNYQRRLRSGSLYTYKEPDIAHECACELAAQISNSPSGAAWAQLAAAAGAAGERGLTEGLALGFSMDAVNGTLLLQQQQQNPLCGAGGGGTTDASAPSPLLRPAATVAIAQSGDRLGGGTVEQCPTSSSESAAIKTMAVAASMLTPSTVKETELVSQPPWSSTAAAPASAMMGGGVVPGLRAIGRRTSSAPAGAADAAEPAGGSYLLDSSTGKQ